MVKSLACFHCVLATWPSQVSGQRAIESGLGSSSSECRSTKGGGSPLRVAEDHTRGGLKEGGREKLRTPVPEHLTFFTFVLATFFLLFLFLFIYFPLSPPPSLFYLFFYFGRKRKCWVSFSFFFFFLSSVFFFLKKERNTFPHTLNAPVKKFHISGSSFLQLAAY